MSKIEWTDRTWNPIIGCSKISPGCDNCYAEKMAGRLASMGTQGYSRVIQSVRGQGHSAWNNKTSLVESALDKPMYWKKPRRIFVCSMGDIFHESVDVDWLRSMFRVIRATPQHIYQFLTKRPENAWSMLNLCCAKPPANVWLGVTCENQATANERIPHLLKCPAAVRFVSVEPMLGPVDLTHIPYSSLGATHKMDALRGYGGWGDYDRRKHKIHLCIVGGESGPQARPMHPDWARDLRDQCQDAGVPFVMKQMSGRTKAERQNIPTDLMIREFPKA